MLWVMVVAATVAGVVVAACLVGVPTSNTHTRDCAIANTGHGLLLLLPVYQAWGVSTFSYRRCRVSNGQQPPHVSALLRSPTPCVKRRCRAAFEKVLVARVGSR